MRSHFGGFHQNPGERFCYCQAVNNTDFKTVLLIYTCGGVPVLLEKRLQEVSWRK